MIGRPMEHKSTMITRPNGGPTGQQRMRAIFLGMLGFASALCVNPQTAGAADETEAPKGAAVTVIRATKTCFDDVVEVFGSLQPREEVTVRPDREGLKFTQVMVDAGDTVTAGQPMAKIGPADGGDITITAPVAGLISASTAAIGAAATAQQPPFRIVKNNEFDLVGDAAAKDILKLKAGQPAVVHLVGGGYAQGVVRSVPTTVDQTSQLGQVQIGITSKQRMLINASGRAKITAGRSCGVSVPLTAILYGDDSTVVQVIRRDRVETHRVDIGLMSGGQVEIRSGVNENDVVVAKAGALLREGDPVRPISEADASPKN
jgi:multidrug efflux pump subunit AcrA (membrane-fusion protein)